MRYMTLYTNSNPPQKPCAVCGSVDNESVPQADRKNSIAEKSIRDIWRVHTECAVSNVQFRRLKSLAKVVACNATSPHKYFGWVFVGSGRPCLRAVRIHI